MNTAADIKVSIVCNAYNHGRYIRDALNGFVMQKTDFEFEVLIHDDASTDDTADIIREFEMQYPHLVKPVYQTENQYSQGVSVTPAFQVPRIKGKYVAFCEGDDYWTDPLKLQKQYDAMEAHPEVDMCANAAIRKDGETGKELSRICPADHDAILPLADVIAGGGGFIASASLFYRTHLLFDLPKFRQIIRYDYTLQMQGALRGGILYIHDFMTVYRAGVAGSWTKRVAFNVEKREKHMAKVREALLSLNEDTEGKYESIIRTKIREDEFELLRLREDYKKMLSKEYRDFFKKLSAKNRFKIRLKAAFPFLTRVKRNFTK